MSRVAPGRLQVPGGGEDRVGRVVRVLEAIAVGVDPVLRPLRGQELHPALGAGAGDAQVAAVVGLDLVDRREHLPGDPVGGAGGLVDRQQERRDLEAFDEEARHARDRRSERQRQRRCQRRRRRARGASPGAPVAEEPAVPPRFCSARRRRRAAAISRARGWRSWNRRACSPARAGRAPAASSLRSACPTARCGRGGRGGFRRGRRVVVAGVVAGASGAGRSWSFRSAVVVSAEVVVPVEDGEVVVGSLAPATAGASASAPPAPRAAIRDHGRRRRAASRSSPSAARHSRRRRSRSVGEWSVVWSSSADRSVAEQVVEQHPARARAFGRGRVVGRARAGATDRLDGRRGPGFGAQRRERAVRPTRATGPSPGISRSPRPGSRRSGPRACDPSRGWSSCRRRSRRRPSLPPSRSWRCSPAGASLCSRRSSSR